MYIFSDLEKKNHKLRLIKKPFTDARVPRSKSNDPILTVDTLKYKYFIASIIGTYHRKTK